MKMAQKQELDVNYKINGEKKVGLRRQPTKYPHGLGVTVQTINEDRLNYSRASTLRSSQKQQSVIMSNTSTVPQINLIGSTDHLKEPEMRRFKYPLTGTYYLDTQEAHKSSPFEMCAYMQRYFNRPNYRCFIIFLACILLCFGLISYGLWLHNISLARERYRLEQEQLNSFVDNDLNSAEITTTFKTNFIKETDFDWLDKEEDHENDDKISAELESKRTTSISSNVGLTNYT